MAVAIKIINAIDIKDHSRWSIILKIFIMLNKVEPYSILVFVGQNWPNFCNCRRLNPILEWEGLEPEPGRNLDSLWAQEMSIICAQ